MKKLLIVGVALLALSPSALAAHLSYDPSQPKPLSVVLDHLDKTLKKNRNKHARALRLAYEQLEAMQFAKTRTFAQPALGDPAFSDYSHWLIASAYFRQSQNQAEKGKLKDAAASARLAFQQFNAVLNGSPYSPFHRQAAKMLGDAQLMLAWGLSPSKESVRAFEDGLERLGIMNGGSSQLLPEQIQAFILSCEKFPNALCDPWIKHLRERRNPPGAAHETQTYHAPDLDFAAFDDAMSSFSAEKWSDALDKFQRFTDEFPKSALRYRARYWLGRTLKEKGKDDEAKKAFEALYQDSPLTYYGLLAATANSEPMDQAVSQTEPMAAEQDPNISAAESYHLKRALSFLAEKSPDLAGMELKEIRPRSTLSGPFVMYLAALSFRAQYYPGVFSMLNELFLRGYAGLSSQIVMKQIFPVAQWVRIKKYAAENKIDPVLVLSLIKQESAFDTHALSGSGASGLMQLMYFTAAETVPGITRTDLLEPEHNIRVGTRYLARLLNKFHGNIVLSLAGYNAGPIAVERWVHEGEKQKYKMLEFIEAIPYRETRDYVSAIIRNYFWYSKILGTPMPQSLSYFWAPYEDLQRDIGGQDLPSPSPSPSASPSPSPAPSLSPSSSPNPSPAPTPTASPTESPSPRPSPAASPSPSGSTRLK